jgi:cystathionine beta-lyase
VLCNPHNPTGTVLPREELEAIALVVERHGGRVFADEIHAPIRFDGRAHVPYASVSDAAAGHTVTGTSASKAWNVPGLKAAQLITSNDADEAVYRRFGFAVVHGASTLGVIAATAAYRDGRDWLDGAVAYLQRNRDLLTALIAERLPDVRWRPPEATYLAWLDLGALALGARGLGDPAALLRDRAGVTLTDGALCGTGFADHVRLVFATPAPVLEDAVDRIAAALAPAVAR